VLKSIFYIFLMLLFSILDNINAKLQHESLDAKRYLQRPEEAFWRRLPEESILGNFYRNLEGEINVER